MKTLKKRFVWKLLSDDGLLKDTPEFGLWYDTKRLKSIGYDTEEEAIADLTRLVKSDDIREYDEFVLVPVYSTR